jgi:hypothetical protein
MREKDVAEQDAVVIPKSLKEDSTTAVSIPAALKERQLRSAFAG